MGKSRNDEIYENGVKAGLEGGFISDAVHGIGKGFGGKDSDIFEKGYEYGVEHRYDSPKKDESKSDD